MSLCKSVETLLCRNPVVPLLFCPLPSGLFFAYFLRLSSSYLSLPNDKRHKALLFKQGFMFHPLSRRLSPALV